ncbi:ATP-dependent DNA helicase PIF1-like, partial [Aphis craccivora]
LEKNEFELIESRFFKKTDVAALCPNGVRLFFKNENVAAYNNFVLSQCEDKVVSTSTDVIIGCKNHEQEANFRIKLHKKSVIDTGGLPYEITFVIGKYYLITTNIDVNDGLCNGSAGKLVYLEFDESYTLIRVWMEFCGSDKVGRKKRQKGAALALRNKVSNLAVPIELRTANISLTSDRKVVVKRKHFPLIAALAMTIHKSQGGTFEEIVYEYSKTHSQELVYVALSRVTNIENLYIVTSDDSTFKFYHNRRQATSTASLLQEFKRLSLNCVQTKAQSVLDFIRNRNGVSIMTFNCQSLNSHKYDLQDSVTRQTNVLLLSETCMSNDYPIDIPNFNCIVHFKRDTVSKGGVAIYQNNNNDTTNIMTPNIDINVANDVDVNVRRTNVGDICACLCKLQNGLEIVIVVIYITPNPKLDEVEYFIHRTLLEYTVEGSKILGGNSHKFPLILAGDFNINFADKKSERLTTFLLEKL